MTKNQPNLTHKWTPPAPPLKWPKPLKEYFNSQAEQDLFRSLFYGNQKVASNRIKKYLTELNIPFQLDTYGNIYSITEHNSPLFVSHLDTVGEDTMREKLSYTRDTHTLSRPGYILGADDRAGVALIMVTLLRGNPLNFLFTLDEEVGGLGASSISKDTIFQAHLLDYGVPCIIEYDRKHTEDLIGYSNDLCGKDLEDEIIALTGASPATGIFTDIDYLCKLLPGVNLSAGYYNAHTTNEYLDMDIWHSKLEELLNLRDGLSGLEFVPAPVPTRRSFSGTYSYDTAYDYSKWDNLPYDDECGSCGALEDDLIYIDSLGIYLCKTCAMNVSDEIWANYKY
jgi:hypothetical protein